MEHLSKCCRFTDRQEINIVLSDQNSYPRYTTIALGMGRGTFEGSGHVHIKRKELEPLDGQHTVSPQDGGV